MTRTRLLRPRALPALLALALLFAATDAARAELPPATQPILVVRDATVADPYQAYVAEILLAEGLNGFQSAELQELPPTYLGSFAVVILPRLALTDAQAAAFEGYVNGGGVLVAFRPDARLSGLFGVTPQGAVLEEGWVKIDPLTAHGAGLDEPTLRFHGEADLHAEQPGTTRLATLYSTHATATSHPAVTTRAVGAGRAVLFAYDLPRTIALMRQGNPDWAGYPNTHDGFGTMRPSQMFRDVGTGTFWNDIGDGTAAENRADVPQADVQMRLLTNAIIIETAATRPLPRFWYFPDGARAALIVTGDQHGEDEQLSRDEIAVIESHGGLFGNYLWYPYGSVPAATVAEWVNAGHEVGIHFDATGLTDASGVSGARATFAGMQDVISTALGAFLSAYPDAPLPTASTRNHHLIWCSVDEQGDPDPTAQARILASAGIAMDTTYSTFPRAWGYMTGSGLPMPFLDIETGAIIPVYQQATHYEDDIQLGSAAWTLGWDLDTARARYEHSIRESAERYHTAVTMLFHPDNFATYRPHVEAALAAAEARGIPIWSPRRLLETWTARRAAGVSSVAFDGTTLSFSVTDAAAGLTVVVPFGSGARAVSAVRVNGAPYPFALAELLGVLHASIALPAGDHAVAVTYAPAWTISGRVTPAAAVATTSLGIVGGPGGAISQERRPAADGTFTLGPFPDGTYTITPIALDYTFAPAALEVTLAGAGVAGADFEGTEATIEQTLYTHQVPAVPTASDGVDYELGTRFVSDVAGQVLAIRFYKAAGEVGTHVGRLWSASGTLLASATFADETASGWQEARLASPVQIAPETEYVVSVNTAGGFYPVTTGGLAQPIASGHLRSVAGGNGVFGVPGQFPSSSFQDSSYFRDVVLATGPDFSGDIGGAVAPAELAAGTTLVLSGAGSGATTVDAAGAYRFAGLAGGVYTVTPSKAGHVFTPPSRTLVLSGGNDALGIDFAVAPRTFAIAGTVVPAADGEGAVVTLGGDAHGTTAVDASGAFAFAGLANGSYSIHVAKGGYRFDPAGAVVEIADADATISFTAAPLAPDAGALSIRIDPPEAGAGARVLLSGPVAGEAIAGAAGEVLFDPLPAGSYVVRPAKPGTTFTPTSRTVDVAGGTADVRFIASSTQTLLGELAPAISAVSDGPGADYELGMRFTSDVRGEILGVRFYKSPAETGVHVGTLWTGAGAPLAAVTFENESPFGWQEQAFPVPVPIQAGVEYVVSVNTGNGFYVLTSGGLANEISAPPLRTLRPDNGVFGPVGAFPAASFESGNYFRDVVFSRGAMFPVSGAVSPAEAGAGTTLTVSGDASETAVADASGAFTIPGLPGGSYTITPSRPGYTFAPSSRTFVAGGDPVTGLDFAAHPVGVGSFSITGTVSPAGESAGTIVSLTGAVNASALVDSLGTYRFTGLPNGEYTLRPSLAGFTFEPVERTVSIAGGDLAAVDFGSSSRTTLLTLETPASFAVSDGPGAELELGMKFTSDIAGEVRGVRFWKSAAESGPHIGKLWTASGELLASVTFEGETAEGWQEQAFPAPVAIAANTVYVVSVNTGNTYYVVDDLGFAAQIVNAPLRSVIGGNGVFGPAGSFPTNNFAASNYFRDVVFGRGPLFSLSGHLIGDCAGAVVTLSGDATAATVADADGAYSFGGLPSGSYVVTPSKGGLAFAPFSAAVTVDGADVTGVDFAGAPAGGTTFTIFGSVAPAEVAAGATIALSGPVSGSTTVDAAGAFAFTGLPDGAYALFPAKAGVAFTPASRTVTIAGGSVDGVAFEATHTLTILTTETPALANATDGPGAEYELGMKFTSDEPGEVLAIRFWKAPSETGAHVGKLWTASGALLASVTFSNETAAGWQVQALPSPVAIQAGQTYVVSVNTAGSYYVVTGSGLASQVASPPLRSVAGENGVFGPAGQFPTSSWHDSNYFRDIVFKPGAVVPTYVISGTISPASDGAGATVALSGDASATTTAAPDGTYSFTGLADGSYTVTPAKAGIAFAPSSRSLTISGASAGGIDFAATPAGGGGGGGLTLLEAVTPAVVGANDGVDYELGMKFTADVDGSISAIRFWKSPGESGQHVGKLWSGAGQLLASTTFAEESASGWQEQPLPSPVPIVAGTVYVVSVNTGAGLYALTSGGLAQEIAAPPLRTVVGQNGVFGPAGAFPTSSWNDSNYFRDVRFEAAPPSLDITGRVLPIAYGAGATVFLQGGTVATTTADGTGAYRFRGLADGAYTVRVEKSGLHFAPATRDVTIAGESVAGIDFTAAIESAGNPIVLENALPGTTAWEMTNPASEGEIEGFASDVSVNRGESITFFVQSRGAAYTLDVYRLGWYGGAGARLVRAAGTLPGQDQPDAERDLETGRIECLWAPSYTLETEPAWTSGHYLAKLRRTDTGKEYVIPFVVRDDASTSAILMQSSVNTMQAYNYWGGKSVYHFQSDWVRPTEGVGTAAVKVSFDRPYRNFIRTAIADDSEHPLRWEYPMLRWLESQGFDVTYSTNLDTHLDAGAVRLRQHRLFLSVGHDEYWSSAMRDHVEMARDAGVNLAFFSANTGYWQVRYEPSSSGVPNRTMVAYKDSAEAFDPLFADPARATTRFRDPPVNRPENRLLGVMYGSETNDPNGFPFVVTNAGHPLFRNTGLADGEGIYGIVGNEWDNLVGANKSNDPANIPGIEVLSHSPTTSGSWSNATIYQAPSGALVFAGGSIQWSWGLDDSTTPIQAVDDRFRQLTANVLVDLGALPATPSDALRITRTLTVSGRITPAVAGATVTLAGATTRTTETRADGTYAFALVLDGAYTVSAAKAGYTITPANVPVTVAGSNVLDVDFAAEAGGGTSGDIAGAVTPTPLGEGVALTLGGAATGSTVTDATGAFRFDALPNGTYTVTPSKDGVIFMPASRTVEVLGADVLGVDFAAVDRVSVFTTQAPFTDNASDGPGNDYELGMRFTSDMAGEITAIRFWKAASETGTHVGKLWSESGELLATVTFVDEKSAGWQEAALATPVPIEVGVEYVVTVNTGATYYVVTTGGLANEIVSGPLRTVVGQNGVFGPAGEFPSGSWNGSNYFRDVVFRATEP